MMCYNLFCCLFVVIACVSLVQGFAPSYIKSSSNPPLTSATAIFSSKPANPNKVRVDFTCMLILLDFAIYLWLAGFPSSPTQEPLTLPLVLADITSLYFFQGGRGIGRMELDEGALTAKTIYDMVLVERIPPPPATETGLYKPEEEQPKLHLAKVLSVGPGREEENGILASMPAISEGDTVVVKNPWGIGPKDEEVRGSKERSDGKRITTPSCITNNLPLVASLLVSPFIPTLFAIRFAHHRLLMEGS